jgi:hypothetical protein
MGHLSKKTPERLAKRSPGLLLNRSCRLRGAPRPSLPQLPSGCSSVALLSFERALSVLERPLLPSSGREWHANNRGNHRPWWCPTIFLYSSQAPEKKRRDGSADDPALQFRYSLRVLAFSRCFFLRRGRMRHEFGDVRVPDIKCLFHFGEVLMLVVASGQW